MFYCKACLCWTNCLVSFHFKMLWVVAYSIQIPTQTLGLGKKKFHSNVTKIPFITQSHTSSFSAFCRSLHSSVRWLKSTLFICTLTSPIASCLEKRSKSYTVMTSVFPPSSVYGTCRQNIRKQSLINICYYFNAIKCIIVPRYLKGEVLTESRI